MCSAKLVEHPVCIFCFWVGNCVSPWSCLWSSSISCPHQILPLDSNVAMQPMPCLALVMSWLSVVVSSICIWCQLHCLFHGVVISLALQVAAWEACKGYAAEDVWHHWAVSHQALYGLHCIRCCMACQAWYCQQVSLRQNTSQSCFYRWRPEDLQKGCAAEGVWHYRAFSSRASFHLYSIPSFMA